MYRKGIKSRKTLVYRIVISMFLFPLLSGLFACGSSHPYTNEANDIISFSTSSQGMSRTPNYVFSLQKKEGEWFFSAACYAADHRTSFTAFPISAQDAEGFLEILREEGEIRRLRKYREPLLTLLFKSQIRDGKTYYSAMTFGDASKLEKDTRICARALDYLYALAEKHCQAAESVEIRVISVRTESPDPSHCCSFTLERNEYECLLSFSAPLDDGDSHRQAEKREIGMEDEEEILRIVREEQLVEKVKQYDSAAKDGTAASEETACQICFQFADGSSACAPIDAESELMAAFYSLAQGNV